MGSSIAVNHNTFATEVLEQSFQKLILVDFFAQWCGPCRMLKPVLEKLAQEYDFVLAQVDIDANPDLAKQYGVEGLPDVRVVSDGQVSQGFVGMLPEPQIRQLLVQLKVKSNLNESLDELYAHATQGRVEQAEEMLAQLLQQYPDDRELLLEAANFYIQADQLSTADALLSKISDYDKAFITQAKSLKALLQFKQIAKETGEAHELDCKFQQAARLVLEEDYSLALQQFLDILTRNRKYREDGARKAMLAVFDLLGNNHPLTQDYRKRLTMALY